MDTYNQILQQLKQEYEKDENVLSFLVTGSVARKEAKSGNDLDILLVVKEGKFSKEYREGNILVELGGNTLTHYISSLENNPMQIYMYLDAIAVFDNNSSLITLKNKAEEILQNYKVDKQELKEIKKWLSSVVDKVTVAQENNDQLKVGFHVSNVLWKMVEGLYAINSIPTPASTSALRRVNTLKKLPDNFEDTWEKTLLGNLEERTKSTMELLRFILLNLN